MPPYTVASLLPHDDQVARADHAQRRRLSRHGVASEVWVRNRGMIGLSIRLSSGASASHRLFLAEIRVAKYHVVALHPTSLRRPQRCSSCVPLPHLRAAATRPLGKFCEAKSWQKMVNAQRVFQARLQTSLLHDFETTADFIDLNLH